ncbi:transposable element Tc1 transposase [Trichonephila clavipes]|nr:transposable element Tc1 transposase [Trichonephila clavipes]
MDLPVRSPDLIRIQPAWSALGRTIFTCNCPSRIVQGLKPELLNEWDYLPQKLMNSLISRVKSRCDVCLSERGNHIPNIFFCCILHNCCFIPSNFYERYARSCARTVRHPPVGAPVLHYLRDQFR